MRKTLLIGAAGYLLLAMTACSSVTHESGQAAPAGSAAPASASASPSASAAASTPAGASASPAGGSGKSTSGTPKAPAAKPKKSASFVPMQTANGGEFASPTGNITCEVDKTTAYCQTGSPSQSVTMKSSGAYTSCTGPDCLGNAGEGTPTLSYGQATGVGPFRCESSSAGVTCTAGGKGFRISNSGIVKVTS